MVTRIAVGAVLGGVIGYERDRHKRPVGLRTHTIVAMTAATFMIVSTQFVYLQTYKEGELIGVDSSRIAASVVSGIGFLAGGEPSLGDDPRRLSTACNAAESVGARAPTLRPS